MARRRARRSRVRRGRSLLGRDITLLCTLDFATSLVEIPLDPSLVQLARWHADVSARPSAKA